VDLPGGISPPLPFPLPLPSPFPFPCILFPYILCPFSPEAGVRGCNPWKNLGFYIAVGEF